MQHDKIPGPRSGGPSTQRVASLSGRCPTHGHSLVNIHKVREGERLVIGQTCPEPHCQHFLMVPRPNQPEPARNAG
jgi:hypothetical protein